MFEKAKIKLLKVINNLFTFTNLLSRVGGLARYEEMVRSGGLRTTHYGQVSGETATRTLP